jgi:hypothetical protein
MSESKTNQNWDLGFNRKIKRGKIFTSFKPSTMVTILQFGV